MRRILFLASLLTLVIIITVGSPKTVLAADNSKTPPITSYEYIARPGDSLSLLTRKSLQLYAKAKNTQLSSAAAMYCENNVATKLGNRRLEINEQVSIPFDLLQQYIVNSRSLDAVQLDAWNTYAQNANFNLSDLHPINESAAQSVAQPNASSTSTQSSSQKQPDTKAKTNESKTEKPAIKFSWPNWFATLSITVIVAYAFKKFEPDHN